MITRERGARPRAVPMPFIAAVVLEQIYYDKLRALVNFASQSLDIEPPWHVECGLVGIQGLNVSVPPDEFRVVRKTDVILRVALNSKDAASLDSVLLAFFCEFHDATGYARPVDLGGFPPARPQWPPAN
jgi:hypothetical protein